MAQSKTVAVPSADGNEVIPGSKGTTVNVALALALGAGGTVAFYFLLLLPPLSWTYLRPLFCARGLTQYVTAAAFFWGVAILALKVRMIRQEAGMLRRNLLTEGGQQLIRQEDALQFIRKLKRLSPRERRYLLPNRIWRALVRFKLLGNAEKVDDTLKYQSEIDTADMESSYSFLKFLITVVPIFGFLGTVMGISAAVSGFSAVINAAENLDMIKTSLSQVTIGLAVAFDTTLAALVMSAILMLGLTIFQRIEDTLLSRIENYCIDHLLDHLWVPPLHEQIEAALSRSNATLVRHVAEEFSRQFKDRDAHG